MNKQQIKNLTNDVIKVANKYIDEDKMNTEDVYGALCGAGYLIVQASKTVDVSIDEDKSIVEDNLK